MNYNGKKLCISFLVYPWTSSCWCVSKRHTWLRACIVSIFQSWRWYHTFLKRLCKLKSEFFLFHFFLTASLDRFLSNHYTACCRGLSWKSLAFLVTNKADSHFLCLLAIWTSSFMKCFLFVANFKIVSIKVVLKISNKKSHTKLIRPQIYTT